MSGRQHVLFVPSADVRNEGVCVDADADVKLVPIIWEDFAWQTVL